jgi:hypothetical protein
MKPYFDDLLDKIEDVAYRVTKLMFFILAIIVLGAILIFLVMLLFSDNPENTAHALKAVSEQPLFPAQFQLSGFELLPHEHGDFLPHHKEAV